VLHGSGGFGNWLIQLAKTDVVVLDDWGVTNLDPATRADLLEIVDDRAAHKATIITTQLPVDHWHAWIGDATIADAILDRIMQRVHRVDLAGPSLREPPDKPASRKAATKAEAASKTGT
jgi:DNA replication protein DnaC